MVRIKANKMLNQKVSNIVTTMKSRIMNLISAPLSKSCKIKVDIMILMNNQKTKVKKNMKI